MKLWLDDLRKAPFGWHRVKTADECIETLQRVGDAVTELSLDHDLAEEHYEGTGYSEAPRTKTGYAVVAWMVENNVWPPVIYLHTLNPVGRENMRSTLARHAPEHVTVYVKPALGFAGGVDDEDESPRTSNTGGGQ